MLYLSKDACDAGTQNFMLRYAIGTSVNRAALRYSCWCRVCHTPQGLTKKVRHPVPKRETERSWRAGCARSRRVSVANHCSVHRGCLHRLVRRKTQDQCPRTRQNATAAAAAAARVAETQTAGFSKPLRLRKRSGNRIMYAANPTAEPMSIAVPPKDGSMMSKATMSAAEKAASVVFVFGAVFVFILR